ncbi:hypothetical protein JMJ77_0007043 [Colletotrichum scovillei]|uniref:Mid2 domain-containing protein n=1 Tax=Colletotrichum scovillei TaxID=1209932 RepID=A0A9P7UKX3_9PEZI|nr:hypothetical protein JMJ77_0007043 [Colletotrichum scovillei]KAG7074044.1 hypothetical protein JMJ76_0010532 [Colletotrichum scovillei]KAG7081120.1 hypothetical protein JMJ78_0003248 [Colletotrichum scovillei]
MITVSTILPFVGLLAAVVALENVRFANSPANSARLGAEPTKADLWPAAPTMPPHLRFAAIPLKPRDSSQNCGYFETDGDPWNCGDLACNTRGNIFGCGSSPWASCLDYDSPICSQNSQGSLTACCTDIKFPFCATGIKFITRDSIITLEAFNCGNNMFTGVHYLVDSFSSSTTSTSSSSSSPSTISPDTPASTVPSESRTAPSDSNTAAPAPSPQTENAPPIGAIVGGAIAGLVVMGLIVTAIVWMILRNRRKASKDNDNNGGPAGTNQPYTYATVPATRATSEWQSSTPAPMYEPYKSNRQSGNSGPYQHQSTTPSQSPDPTSRSGALPNDYSPNRVSEVPATNPAGTGNNASELHSDHVQRT